MSRLKYVYTPRRRQPPPRRTGISLPPVLVAPLLIGAVLIGWWLLRDGGSSEAQRDTQVLGASCAPGQSCSASGASPTTGSGGATQTPRPRQELAPAGEADPPTITGVAAYVLEEPCGNSLYELNPHTRVPPASLTKIMTALVAVEHTRLTDAVDITVNGPELSLATDSTVMGIEPGMTLTMRDLLYGLLLVSGTDAAIQIAEHVSGDIPSFVKLMNEKATAIGLTDTRFTNPHGLDDVSLYSSAHDMAIMGQQLLKNPDLAEIVGTRDYQPGWDEPALKNLNLLLGFYPGAIGVKTGFTDLAGQTIVGAAERDGRRVIVSVMGAQTEIYGDASVLLDWAFDETNSACAPVRPSP
jgi:D-alanyl-D-alanine carboxypeptidase